MMKVLPVLLPVSAVAFAPGSQRVTMVRPRAGPLSSSISPETDPMGEPSRRPNEDEGAAPMSRAIPFMECPATLVDSDLAGNEGFDPLGLSKNKGDLWHYRESEIKHSRLAMLAVVWWPMSELFDRQVADYLSINAVHERMGGVFDFMSNSMYKVSPVWWGACLGLTASIELYGVSRATSDDPTYFPGNLGFDPLSFYPSDKEGQKKMELAEIKHGRLAMVALALYMLREYVTDMNLLDDIPFIFLPLSDAVERFEVA